ELELAANELGALAHAAHAKAALQAIAARSKPVGFGKSFAVVGDGCRDDAGALADADDGARCFGVAADVRQCLLHDPVNRALPLGVPAAAVVLLVELDLDLHVEPVDRLSAPGE